MKLPPEKERAGFYQEVVQACLQSRDDRIASYERWRAYYLYGAAPEESPALYNKILPQMDLLVSFLFAAETVKFAIIVDPSAHNEREIAKVPALTQQLNTKWAESNADVQYGQAVTWALVYGSMFIKLIQRGRNTYPYIVDPHSFGVLREDMPFLDDQDAFVHTYTISRETLPRLLDAHPQKTQILSSVAASFKSDHHEMPTGLGRIMLSTFPMTGTPSGPGQLTYPGNISDGYRARIADERVEMHELWVWDDDANDYRIVTMASGAGCIYDRANFYLAGEHDFIQVCPNPSYDYFFGHSEVDRLVNLQGQREKRMAQIDELLDRQVKPPTSRKGMWQGIPDETDYASQVFGGGMTSTDPTAEFKAWAPTVPTDTYAEIREIDGMFNEMTGLSNVTQGKGESGVRSKGHAAELARLGSSRIRKRAFTLEDGLDKMGTHYLKLAQQHDPTHLKDKEGKEFIAEQFTKDATVKVDGHSSSPLFVEDHKALMGNLFEARAIDRASLIEGMNPPGKQVLLERLKVIEAAEKKAHEEEVKAEQASKLKSVK